MTKYFAVVTAEGQALQRSVLDGDPLGPPMNGDRYVEVSEDLDVSAVYFDGDVAIPLPESPSEHHRFDYVTKAWVDCRNPTTEWEKVRVKRNSLLLASDFTQGADSPVDKEIWAAYRADLRNITQQEDPFSIVWPQRPA